MWDILIEAHITRNGNAIKTTFQKILFIINKQLLCFQFISNYALGEVEVDPSWITHVSLVFL